MEHAQRDAAVRMDWGLSGAEAVGADAAIAVVVDVLSFTTTLTVAIDAGAEVYPFRWKDTSARAFAEEHDAVLAVGRSEARDAGPAERAVSLSPASIQAAKGLNRIVLPSPNGSTLAHELAEGGATVIGAALRNRFAVARWIADLLAAEAATSAATGARPADTATGARPADTATRSRPPAIAVLAAGERWPDGSLRPAVEDLWGAGAVIAALSELGIGDQSPEAWTAEAAFRGVEESLAAELAGCATGQELAMVGFADDVAIAADLDSSRCVPVLIGERFLNAG
jgi:2-phosphosulfolactate phosphatase